MRSMVARLHGAGGGGVVPYVIVGDLREHLDRVREQHERDLVIGAGWVELPSALRRKLLTAGREWVWQWVFPATRRCQHVETGQVRRHHLHETVVQESVRRAVRSAGLS